MVFDSFIKQFRQPQKENENVYNDILLNQGDLFLSYQQNYYQKVAPRLHMMERSSSPHLESVVEGLSNIKYDTNKNSKQMEKSAADLRKLKQLEQEYNSVLNQYISTTKQISIIDVNNLEKSDTLQSELMRHNSKLVSIAEQIYKNIEKTESGNLKDPVVIKKQQQLLQKIKELKSQKKKLIDVELTDKYRGEYADSKIRVNYAYYHYIIWFLIVVILITSTTMIFLNIPFPSLDFPFSLIYVALIIGILWILARAIQARFWKNL